MSVYMCVRDHVSVWVLSSDLVHLLASETDVQGADAELEFRTEAHPELLTLFA